VPEQGQRAVALAQDPECLAGSALLHPAAGPQESHGRDACSSCGRHANQVGDAAVAVHAGGWFLLEEVPVAQLSGDTRMMSMLRELIYVSFVTPTILGYGDIGPSTGVARVIFTPRAVVAQRFVAVFVARLAALPLAHASRHAE
jgi:hypothetical protein